MEKIDFESPIVVVFATFTQYFPLIMLNLSNFVSLPGKLDNPYYHSIQQCFAGKVEQNDDNHNGQI